MQITKVQFFAVPQVRTKLLCYARIEFDAGALRVSNVEIWRSPKDHTIRVGWPTRRWENGTWSEIVTPASLLRKAWEKEILDAWEHTKIIDLGVKPHE